MSTLSWHIIRYGYVSLDTVWIRLKHPSGLPCTTQTTPRPACCGPASELGCSSCFIRPLERVQTRAGSTGGDWSRLGTKPAILVGSWIAGVGAELDRGRLPTLYLGRAGRLSTPTGVWIKRGVKSPVGFGAGVASGQITRSSWEHDGSLVPWTSTCTSDFSTSNRDSPAGHALVSPGPSGPKRSRISPRHRDLSGRCPSSKRFPKPTIPDQDSHKIPLSARSATSDDAYARRFVCSR